MGGQKKSYRKFEYPESKEYAKVSGLKNLIFVHGEKKPKFLLIYLLLRPLWWWG